jgi:hypothetical protein
MPAKKGGRGHKPLDAWDIFLIMTKVNEGQQWGPWGDLTKWHGYEKWNQDDTVRWWATAIGIALAESGGRYWINNKGTNSDGSIDYGLWQINDVHKSRFLASWSKVYDPVTNTRMAAALGNDRKDFTAWSAFNSGAYKQHYGAGQAAYQRAAVMSEAQLGFATADLLGTLVPGGIVTGKAAPVIDAIANPVGQILSWLKSAGVVAGVFVLALLLLIIGFWAVVSQTKTGKVAVGAATKAATKGLV